MTESIKIMIQVVEKHAANKTEANFYELFQALTLDVIGNILYIFSLAIHYFFGSIKVNVEWEWRWIVKGMPKMNCWLWSNEVWNDK